MEQFINSTGIASQASNEAESPSNIAQAPTIEANPLFKLAHAKLKHTYYIYNESQFYD